MIPFLFNYYDKLFIPWVNNISWLKGVKYPHTLDIAIEGHSEIPVLSLKFIMFYDSLSFFILAMNMSLSNK